MFGRYLMLAVSTSILVSFLWKRQVCCIPYCIFGDGRVICFVKSECGMGTAKW